MPTSIEDAVEIYRVELPSSCNRRDVLIQPSNERDMSGTGLGRDASMRYAKGATF